MREEATAEPDGIPDAYRRTRIAATGLFFLMAGLFVTTLLWQESYPALSWLRAFAEAAMVGALADWYAVTALFRQPLGLPIPHTEIIPRNKNRIALSIGSLTQRKLVTPDAIGRLIESWHVPQEVMAMLIDPGRRRVLTQEWAGLLARLLEASEDAAMQRFFRHLATQAIRHSTIAPLLGRMLSSFLQSPRRDRLVDDACGAVTEYVETHRDQLVRLIADKLPWSRMLSLINLDEKVANKFVDWFGNVLYDMQADHEDPVRLQLIERLEMGAQWLMQSEQALRREADVKEKILTYEALLDLVDESWHNLKRWLLMDLKAEHSEVRDYLDEVLSGLGKMVQDDQALLSMLQRGLQDLVVELASRHRDKIGELVTTTVSDWTVAHMVATIEREVGKDLQFIRINGTIVGGIVGLLLHAIAVVMGK
ncbi:hypothetical protein W02_36460 [Nitrospira sp. KM1]|uniref:DUF445 domain-containing protein n=1 Tax=Nitrospira sp. KM1 TaxID=1936990 RepID=UPI0013A78E20|nr:DUF445 domain-containing protein [Nitrospira sp. KM1]BCA56506.1 hypothetical protein W02_36460 [Nitrospira sp. KM1]